MMPPRAGLAHKLRQEGKTYDQIAKVMKCSTGSISQYLRTAEAHVNGTANKPQRVFYWELHPRRCGRCRLLLEGSHECLPRRAEGFLRAQEGHGEL